MKILKFLLFTIVFLSVCELCKGDNIVILHTNDMHSQIDPADNGLGGVVRRKVLIDSVRNSNENVLVIDAGDVVQGTMYFTIYKGEVEYGLLDDLEYDIAVLGNHDFDNGVMALAENLKNSKVTWLSANYDFSGAPDLDSIFVPNVIKEYNGKKIGIFGINLVPEGMIAEGNYDGVKYIDAYSIANAQARELRERGADYVIAVTHIGYIEDVEPTDINLAAKTEGIDLIIGGHSHSLILPDTPQTEKYHWKHVNAVGDTVYVVQAGSRGAYLGQITLDMDKGSTDYCVITVDERLDSQVDSSLVKKIDVYRNAVDSIMHVGVGTAVRRLGKDDAGLMNFLGDFVAWRGEEVSGRRVDMSLINAGGVRRELPEGEISKGMLIDMLPFNNKIVVLEINGSDLLEAIDAVIRRGGFDGTKEGIDITFDPATKKHIKATINGKAIRKDKTYVLATIDYLANGGDYMSSLPRAKEIGRSGNVMYDDLIFYVENCWSKKPIDGNPERHIHPVEK